MPRMLTSLKFWALTSALLWLTIIVVVIAFYPEFSYAPQ